MSQFDFGTIDPYVVDGVQLAGMLNQWRDAVHSWHRGPSRPAYVVPGMMWVNDSGGAANWVVNVFMGATIGDMPIFGYDTTTGAITWLASSTGTFVAQILHALSTANPAVWWTASNNPIDAKQWRETVTGTGALRLGAYNDAGVETAWIQFNRDGTITSSRVSAEFYATQNNISFITTAGGVCFYDVVTGNAGAFYNPATGRFTPPAGRYHLFASAGYYSSSTSIGNEQTIRKNGASALYSYSVSQLGGVPTTTAGALDVDANGTDYFDVLIRSSGVTPSGGYQNPALVFGAFRVGA